MVGASTVYEAIVANHMGLKVLGFSSVVCKGTGLDDKMLSHEEVLEVSKRMMAKFNELMLTIVPELFEKDGNEK